MVNSQLSSVFNVVRAVRKCRFMNIVGINSQNNYKSGLPNFKSKIKLVNYSDFRAMTDGLSKKKHEVGRPWTAGTMKFGKNLYTTNLLDCICVAIVKGKKVKLGHLCTMNREEALERNQKPFDISEVERRLFEGIDTDDENIHGFILGGFNYGNKNLNNYREVRQVEQLFQKRDIPYTAVCGRKDVHQFGRFGIFYKNNEDTFYISTTLTELPAKEYDSLKTRPRAVEINDNGVTYNAYRNDLKYGKYYDWERKCGTAKTFFEDQYCNVRISEFDEIV